MHEGDVEQVNCNTEDIIIIMLLRIFLSAHCWWYQIIFKPDILIFKHPPSSFLNKRVSKSILFLLVTGNFVILRNVYFPRYFQFPA